MRKLMESQEDIHGKIPPPSHKNVVNWVAEASAALRRNPDLIRKSFICTGLTLDPSQVSDSHLKSALSKCADSLKEQFGDNFNSTDFDIELTDDLYKYDVSENPFSSDED